MERTDQPTRQPTPGAPRQQRTATPTDIVNRLKSSRGLYQWTAITALGWGMGPAQDGITNAVHAAEQAGLVRTTTRHGKTLVQMAPRTDRIHKLRASIARRALNAIGTTANSTILATVRTGSVLTVATTRPGADFPYAIDSIRIPLLDADDPDAPKEWALVDQYGAFDAPEMERLLDDAVAYAHTVTAGR